MVGCLEKHAMSSPYNSMFMAPWLYKTGLSKHRNVGELRRGASPNAHISGE